MLEHKTPNHTFQKNGIFYLWLSVAALGRLIAYF